MSRLSQILDTIRFAPERYHALSPAAAHAVAAETRHDPVCQTEDPTMKRMVVFLLFALPGVAAGQEFSYTYVQGSVLSSELNDVGPLDADGDGIRVAGSVSILPRFHVFGSYQDEGFDFDLDRTTLQIGAGYRYALQQDFDLVGRLSYVEADVERPGPDLTNDGFEIEGGIRGRFTARAEFDAGIRYMDLGESDTALYFDGRFFLQPTLAVGGGLTSDDGDLTLRADIRFLFAGR